MLPVDIRTLAQQVRAILADPQAVVPATGDITLDKTLAALSIRRRSGRPLAGLHVDGPYWHAESTSIFRVHSHG